MRKAFLLILVGVMAMSVNACAKKNNPASDAISASPAATATSAAPAQTDAGQSPATKAEAGQKAAPTLVPPSSNKTVVKDEDAPKVYGVLSESDGSDITYHLKKDCPQLKGKNATELPWQLVKIGFHQCPVCNPPKYEGYVD